MASSPTFKSFLVAVGVSASSSSTSTSSSERWIPFALSRAIFLASFLASFSSASYSCMYMNIMEVEDEQHARTNRLCSATSARIWSLYGNSLGIPGSLFSKITPTQFVFDDWRFKSNALDFHSLLSHGFLSYWTFLNESISKGED